MATITELTFVDFGVLIAANLPRIYSVPIIILAMQPNLLSN